jgi:NAD+ kinase
MSGSSGVPVGVVDDHEAVVRAVETAGGVAHVGDAAEVVAASPAAVVAIGEDALVDLVVERPDAPVLPVAAGRGPRSVPGMAVEPAVASLVSDDYDPVDLPVLSTTAGETGAQAVFDLTLVTEEPARISEFTVRAAGERVDRFRADGVTVGTPAGSRGYTRAAGGPLVHTGTGVVAVVPIAPFATEVDDWILPEDAVELAVERDEAPVELLADGRSAGTVVASDPVTIQRDGHLTVAVTAESYGYYGD